jgi:hypothetical protein
MLAMLIWIDEQVMNVRLAFICQGLSTNWQDMDKQKGQLCSWPFYFASKY